MRLVKVLPGRRHTCVGFGALDNLHLLGLRLLDGRHPTGRTASVGCNPPCCTRGSMARRRHDLSSQLLELA